MAIAIKISVNINVIRHARFLLSFFQSLHRKAADIDRNVPTARPILIVDSRVSGGNSKVFLNKSIHCATQRLKIPGTELAIFFR